MMDLTSRSLLIHCPNWVTFENERGTVNNYARTTDINITPARIIVYETKEQNAFGGRGDHQGFQRNF